MKRAIMVAVHRSPAAVHHGERSARRGGWIHYLRWVDWPWFLCMALIAYPVIALVLWAGPSDMGVAGSLTVVLFAILACAYFIGQVRRVALARIDAAGVENRRG